MIIRKAGDGKDCVATTRRNISSTKPYSTVFLAKTDLLIGKLHLPKEFWGKKIRFVLEVVE